MTWRRWLIWAILLIAQNASFTLVSRARNSGSLEFNAIASVLSNGIWFASQFILIDSIVKLVREHHIRKAVVLGVFYVACTVFGSVTMQWISMQYIETGKRAVGAR
jgi:hypothetical protein